MYVYTPHPLFSRQSSIQYHVIDCVFLSGRSDGEKKNKRTAREPRVPVVGVAVAVTTEVAPGHVCTHVYGVCVSIAPLQGLIVFLFFITIIINRISKEYVVFD